VSIGVNDMVVPPSRSRRSSGGRARGEGDPGAVRSGLVTNGERYNKVVDIWSRTNDQVAKAMMEKLGVETSRREGRKGGQQSRSTRST
jgi:DNA-directed RNA polymerase subunit beta'